jgi:hypothetical protein
MGIRDGAFTVLFEDVEVDAGGGVPDRVGGMACVTVVGETDGPDAVGGPDCGGCEMAAESSRC